jgi:hypothetical protein
MEKEVESPIKLSLLFVRMSIGAGIFVYRTLSAGINVEWSGCDSFETEMRDSVGGLRWGF